MPERLPFSTAEVALTSSNRVIGGRLRLDMPVAFGRRILLPILLEIAKPHPRLTLTLSITDAIVDPLHDDVDLVIRFGTLPDTHGLIARKLTSQKLLICAAPSYLCEHCVPRSLADLGDHWHIVGMPKGPPVSWPVQDSGCARRFTPTPCTNSAMARPSLRRRSPVSRFARCRHRCCANTSKQGDLCPSWKTPRTCPSTSMRSGHGRNS